MAAQMVLLAPAQTVGSGGSSSVTFSSIPQTYTDLYILCSARTNRTAYNTDRITAKINTVTTNMSYQEVQGGASFGTNAALDTTAFVVGHATTDANSNPVNIFSSSSCYISGYTTANYKIGLMESALMNTSTDGFMYITRSTWVNSAAITTLELVTTNPWYQYSKFYLYGIKNS